MKKLKVLIADSQVMVRQRLLDAMKRDEQIEVIASVDNGKDAYELFLMGKPNIVVFDLLLPVYDGFSLLDKLNEYGIDRDTKLIMTTPLTSDLIVREASNKGVDYIITKPYDIDSIVIKIKNIYNSFNKMISLGMVNESAGVRSRYSMKNEIYFEKLDAIISDKLDEIGIPARLKGYRYMITAIKEVIYNENALEGITKILYPDVAKKHNSTPQRVEKAIRHAIEVAWSMDSESSFKQQFTYMLNTKKIRPTNSEFIAKVSQDIRHSA